jgi:outer membrane protein TolC
MRFGFLALAAWCLLAAVDSRAEELQLPASAVPVLVDQPAAADIPLRDLTIQQAFILGLRNSRAVQSAKFRPLQAAEDYEKARTIYDPAIFLVSTAERTDRPTQSLLDGVPVDSALLEDRWQVQAGIKNRLPTGGSLALYQEGGRLESTSSYVTPDPQYQSRVVASLTQPLLKGIGDWEGATNIEVAGLNRQISESAFKRDVTDIMTEIAQGYWQLYFEQNVVRITRESLDRAQEIHRREKVRAERGLSKPVDVDRALVAMKNRGSNLLRAKNQARVTMRQLWLSLAPEQMFAPGEMPELVIKEVPPLEFFPLARRELLAGALNQRQELAIARDTVAVSQQQLSLAAHNQLPVLDLKVNYGFSALDDTQGGLEEDPYTDENNTWSVELAFEWPIGGRSAAAEKRKADYRLMQSRADMQLAAERIAQEVDIVLDELRLAEEEVTTTREAMEAARRVMKGEEVMFELGQKDNQDLLVVQDYYGTAEKEYCRAQTRYLLNLVILSRARGTLLGDYGLKVEELLAVSKNIE